MRGQERARFASPSERKLALTAPAFGGRTWGFPCAEAPSVLVYLTK